jgi:hypothetical protein
MGPEQIDMRLFLINAPTIAIFNYRSREWKFTY